ncbi:hypothetical protein PBAL39_22210 [Pedobacter sp. BAL39]|nr:hypothetical protein PBAL39_22210 [Pedobacter sp. BAL39]
MEKAYNSSMVPIVRVEKRIFTKLLIIPYLFFLFHFQPEMHFILPRAEET